MTTLTKSELSCILIEVLMVVEEELYPDKKTILSEETILMGTGTHLDSLGFIVFLTNVEERLSDETGKEISNLFNMDFITDTDHFQNVGSLASFLETYLQSLNVNE